MKKNVFILLLVFISINVFAVENIKQKTILQFSLDQQVQQMRAFPVNLGKYRGPGVLLVYSEDWAVDAYHEMFHYPQGTYKFALVSESGQILWKKDLGKNVTTGSHFCPVYILDLDKDGKDEIWFVNHTDPEHPLALSKFVLERLDSSTGLSLGQWPWPKPYEHQSMSHTYRFFIFGGYVKNVPVLMTAQGIYGVMSLQAWNPDMNKRWELTIAIDDPGARGAHYNPVTDLNNDGIQEVMWGERCIELDQGKEVFCHDKENYSGHSDIIDPFKHPQTGEWLIYTCREKELKVAPRVAVFDSKGERVWGDVDYGHMDAGWIGNIGPNSRPIAMAIRIKGKEKNKDGVFHDKVEQFTWDAITGEPVNVDFDLYRTKPVDFNGDGTDELIRTDQFGNNEIMNNKGEILLNFKGYLVGVENFFQSKYKQLLCYDKDGNVRFISVNLQ